MDSATVSTKLLLLPNPNPKFRTLRPPILPRPSPSNLRLRCDLGNPSTTSFSRPAVAPPASDNATVSDSPRLKLGCLVSEFESLTDPLDRLRLLLRRASLLPPLPDPDRVPSNRVMGCTAQVWLAASADPSGRMRFAADSDSEVTRGLCACLVSVLDGAAPEEVMEIGTEDLAALSAVVATGKEGSRVNTWHNVLVGMKKRTRLIMAAAEGKPPGEMFPSLVITADGIEAKGSYAEAQAKFLSPDESKIGELVSILKEKKIGIVAHFYMDPEVQGVLTAAQKLWPHIHISDSLVMADSAVKMAEAGCEYIAVLGVDFMSENVRAILDQAGFNEVGVYRMSNERIGCSLADAAANPAYMDFLEDGSSSPPSLHVIYINTSLETKARGHELVPTITCTSSNVVQTILQAFAQVPDLNLYYGPDSYMGANIAELFRQMANMTDDEISEIHPKHNKTTIRSVLSRLHYYQDGTCIVHDLFGHEVVEKIRELYCDAFLTAHFEVPGEMFSLAMEAKRRSMGVVGSTKNILDFIKERVQEALDRNVDDHLQFVLGTESGMVTSIVAAVRRMLDSSATSPSKAKINVEIVFPVSSDSVSKMSDNASYGLKSSGTNGLGNLVVVPGVTTGEGCSIHGGCASCPYMKMNSLSSLLRVCRQLPDKDDILSPYKAERFNATTPHGQSVAELGCEPILHMRHFQATGKLSDELVDQILSGTGKGSPAPR
ncbi:hypothetical protein QJS10_CPA16g00382 [Acorus calamus]|uniref:Quinolinate synthase, chloroplastic n=1 Tax=Acorus calamus TaxID=4465 RepID=A0AAV9D0N3_ACOCL|nr:hypothetical protein QJS10_CPA16g00382 [Acorus calamus]